MGFFIKGKPHTVHVQGHSSNQKGLLELSSSDGLKKNTVYRVIFAPCCFLPFTHANYGKHIIFGDVFFLAPLAVAFSAKSSTRLNVHLS